jgi:sedoheptulose-bisphosphatase
MQAFVPASPVIVIRGVAAPTASLSSSHSALVAAGNLRSRAVAPAAAARRTGAAVAPRTAPSMIATGQPLEDWLNLVEKDLGRCTRGIFAACKEIAYKIRTASCDKMSCFNDFGDEQLAIDVLADKVIFDNLLASGVVATASSEEVPVEKPITKGGKFSVAFDPLDGSSIIDTNFSVGTIFGVWPGDKFVGQTGRAIIAAGLAIYGPRTTITLAIDGVDGAHEFLLIDDFSAKHGQWIHTAVFSTVNEGKLFAPGNMRAAQDNPGYQKLLNHYFTEKYQLRYTGRT